MILNPEKGVERPLLDLFAEFPFDLNPEKGVERVWVSVRAEADTGMNPEKGVESHVPPRAPLVGDDGIPKRELKVSILRY